MLIGFWRKKFEDLYPVLVPRFAAFSAAQKDSAFEILNLFLADFALILRFKIKIFFLLIDFWSVIKGGLIFCFLSSEKQQQVLDDFFDSPISLLRKGFWGINTLAKMGVYGQPSVYDEIGYFPRAKM